MSLITRCPACGTMFKVVTDQLKVSQGWVRCGHCAEVFDASAHLQARHMPEAPLVMLKSDAKAHTVNGTEHDAQASESKLDSTSTLTSDLNLNLDSGSKSSLKPGADLPAFSTATEPLADLVAQSVSAPSPDSKDKPLTQTANGSVSKFQGPSVAGHKPSSPEFEVSFVRDAKRQMFWRKTSVRAVLSLVCLLLLALFAGQLALHNKDMLATLEPKLVPWLKTACRHLKCELGPLRQIESVIIDSSSFTKLSNDSFRLGFVIKNNSTLNLMLPALEITLTDINQQTLVRRVLTPAQFGAGNQLLAARSEFSGGVTLQILTTDATEASTRGGALSVTSPVSALLPERIVGYRLLVFYL